LGAPSLGVLQYVLHENSAPEAGTGKISASLRGSRWSCWGGEVATEYGVLPWPAGTAALAAATILRESYGERVGGNNEPQQIIDQVVAFIDREESRFEPDYNQSDLATKARAGWRDSNGIFDFTRDGLREATDGFDFHRVLDVLVEKAALPTRESKVKKISGRSTRVYPGWQHQVTAAGVTDAGKV
jgi:hypothetical protein